MAIIPALEACFKENNTLLQLTDATLAYSLGNLGGFGTPNDASTDITSATILITFPDSSTQTVDVTSQISAGVVVGKYVFTNVTPDSTIDGLYTFLYTITSPSGTVTFTLYKLFLGHIRCCLDKLWTQVPDKMCSECETDTFIDRCLTAEGYYNSLVSMGGCGQLTTITKILTQIQTLCDFEDCNC